MQHFIITILISFMISASAHAIRDNFNSIDGKNYYEFFGISRNADQATIKSAYRKLMMRYHPDRGGEGVLEMSQKINAVNDVLSEPASRQRYDLWIATGSYAAENPSQQYSDSRYESETIQRERELKKNADYVLKEAAKVRAQYPNDTLDQIAEHGRFHVIYVVRYMPDANYTTEELWRMIYEFGYQAFEQHQINEDAFAMLAGGALQYLKERADYGGYGDEKSYLRKMEMVLEQKLRGMRNGHYAAWNTLWKIIKDGKSFYGPPPAHQSCASSLNQTLRFTQNGVTYEIPITISISLGK